MDWERLPVAPLCADVRAYCSHVNIYCKRERLLSSHPWLFAKSNVDCILRLILCKSSLWCKLSVTFVVLLRNLVIDLWYLILKATIAEIIGNEEAMDLYRHTTELGSHVRNNSPNCKNVRYSYCTISSSWRCVDDTLVMHSLFPNF